MAKVCDYCKYYARLERPYTYQHGKKKETETIQGFCGQRIPLGGEMFEINHPGMDCSGWEPREDEIKLPSGMRLALTLDDNPFEWELAAWKAPDGYYLPVFKRREK